MNAALMLHCCVLAAVTAQSPLADIGAAPATALTAQDDKPFRLDSLHGKTVLVSFVFTTCNGTCPITTRTLVRVQDRLKQAGLWGKKVDFVSITLDPARDIPTVLRQYAKNFGADLESWHFLTGSPAHVERVVKAWGIWTKRNESGVLDHSSRVFLIDAKGHEREIYNLDFLTPDAVLQDVNSLLAEAASNHRTEGGTRP
jgi:protein SCO1/2